MFMDSKMQIYRDSWEIKLKDSDDDLDDFKEMISRYTTSYRVVIYVPKANTSENINSKFIKIK